MNGCIISVRAQNTTPWRCSTEVCRKRARSHRGLIYATRVSLEEVAVYTEQVVGHSAAFGSVVRDAWRWAWPALARRATPNFRNFLPPVSGKRRPVGAVIPVVNKRPLASNLMNPLADCRSCLAIALGVGVPLPTGRSLRGGKMPSRVHPSGSPLSRRVVVSC